jgi:signal transduction histidine kinase
MRASLTARRRTFIPALVFFLLLVAMVVGNLLLAGSLAASANRAETVLHYGRNLNFIITGLRDAELGQRGYLLTSDKKFLEPYRKGVTEIEPAMKEVEAVGTPRARALIAELRPLVEAKQREISNSIALHDSGDADINDATLQQDILHNGKVIMDRIRGLVEPEQSWVRATLLDQIQRNVWQAYVLTAASLFSLIVIVVIALFIARQARRQFAELDRARGEAEGALVALKAEAASREKAEGQLRQMQKMESLGALTGGIAHDFNNMLAVVLGGIELAKRRLRSDPDRADVLLDNAREGANRATTLTARLLAFSRNQPLVPAPLDMNKLVGGMCDMLNRTLGDAINVECVYAAGLWRCYADPGEVENAILNLAINGRDAMPEGGMLAVETGNAHIDDTYARLRPDVAPGQYVMVCVTDTGTGMSPEVIERAFDPFFTTKPVGKGTGLGLSQVFGFTKQSGGHVAIYSEVGRGTTVKIYLPRFTGTDPSEVETTATESLPEGKPGEVILIVEDEQRVRHYAVDALRELGYTAISAASPSEALKALDEQPEITLLFTDIVMPEMTGRQLADAALARRSDLKILFTTGYTRNAVVHNGMLDVGVAFLPKPYGMGDLARKIRDVLDGGGVNRKV